MKIAKRLLSSLMVFILLFNIIVCDVMADDNVLPDDSSLTIETDIADSGNQELSEDIVIDSDDNTESNDEGIVNEGITEEETAEIITEEATEEITEEITEEVTEVITEVITEDVTQVITEETTVLTEEITETTAEIITENEVNEVITENEVNDVKPSGGGGGTAKVPVAEATTEATTNKTVFEELVQKTDVAKVLLILNVELNGGSFNTEGWTHIVDTKYSKTALKGEAVTIESPVQTGAKFLGWSISPNSDTVTYAPDTAIVMNSDLSLFAVWELESYKVSFKESIDTDILWQVNIDYGYEIWQDRNINPWLDIPDGDWATVDGRLTADVDIEGNTVTVFKNTNEFNNNEFVYYTFAYQNKNYFTPAGNIVPQKEGFTFRDWYMTTPEIGGTHIEGDTEFIARYLNTNAYIANVNYRYLAGKTAAESKTMVLTYNAGQGSQEINIDFVADAILGHNPLIITSSGAGVYLKNSQGQYEELSAVDMADKYTAVNSEGQYQYSVKLNIEKASFTVLDQGIDEMGGTYCLDFDIVYKPAPTGYVLNYYRETLSTEQGQHSGEFVLYAYDEIKYDTNNKRWSVTSYLPRNGSAINTNSKYQVTDNQGVLVNCYRYRRYTQGTTTYITDDNLGYYLGDTVYPKTVEYEGFIINKASSQISNEGFKLSSDNTVHNLFYSRKDYHLYYLSGSESDEVSNEIYVYGDTLPNPPVVTRQGYSLDTSQGTNGWLYYDEAKTGESPPLTGGTGKKPTTMPANDIYAYAVWLNADTHYTVDIWLEASDSIDYTVEYAVDVPAITGAELNIEEIADAINNGGGLTNYIDQVFPADLKQHFTFNKEYTTDPLANEANMTVRADGTTVVNVLYSRNWYTLEFVLGRHSWRNSYQCAIGTNGGFEDCNWTGSGGNDFPTIYYDNSKIDTVETSDGTYYKLKNGTYSIDGLRYRSAYGYYTTEQYIGGYICATYYICAKYESDISDLWIANGNSISLTDPTGDVNSQDYGGFTTRYKYVSLGPDSGTKYRADHIGRNMNVLNVYATMSDEILYDDSGGANMLTTRIGYTPSRNVNDVINSSSFIVNHRFVAYWATPSTYNYYFAYEVLDGNINEADYTLNSLSTAGDEVYTNYQLGDIIYITSEEKYYIIDSTTIQFTTAAVSNQNQPARQGFTSEGKAYYAQNSDRNIYFFYNRNVYDITLQNVGFEYHPPQDTVNVQFTDREGNTSNLKTFGVDYNTTDNRFTIKHGGNFTYFKDVLDYLFNYGNDNTPYDNVGKLTYPIETKGYGQWEFKAWYQDNKHTTSAWVPEYVSSAYTNFTLYSEWIPPSYDFTFNLGRGYWADENNNGYIWRGASSVPTEYYNRQADMINAKTYKTDVNEAGVLYAPNLPELYAHDFVGWYYFDESECGGTDCTNRVYLDTVLPADDSIANYGENQTYSDHYGRVKLLYRDSTNNRLYYCDRAKGLRYIFSDRIPIYNSINVYAVYQGHDSESFVARHIVKKSEVDDKGINIDDKELVNINDIDYYIIQDDVFTGKKADELYTVDAEYSLKLVYDGMTHNMLPKSESQHIVMNIAGYPEAEVNNGNITYNGEGSIYYTKSAIDTDRYIYYVLFEYTLATEVSYNVYYIDYDEAVRAGYLTDDHPYYTRYEEPSSDNDFLLLTNIKVQKFDVTKSTSVSETAKSIPGYTLMGDWQNELNLLADNKSNNMYFYYKKQTNNTTYNVKYYTMDTDNKYTGIASIVLNNMPGVSGSNIRSELLAKHYDKYINEALTQTVPINGKLPSIEVTIGSKKYYYNVEGQTDSVNIAEICKEVLKGCVNDVYMSTPYIILAANEENSISTYMRYGSIKLTKLDDRGNPLKGAGFTLTRYISNNGELTADGEVTTAVTNENGEYVFYNLYIDSDYVYKLEETTAPGDRYSLLKEPVNIKLPFKSDKTLNGDYDYGIDGEYYWYDVECIVTDNLNFDVPEAGYEQSLNVVVIIGTGLLYLAITLAFIRKRRGISPEKGS